MHDDQAAQTPAPQAEPFYEPPPVAGYRKLSQDDVDAMNVWKAKGAELGEMLRVLEQRNQDDRVALFNRHDVRVHQLGGQPDPSHGWGFNPDEAKELRAIEASERACNQARTFLQTGLMWATRAIAKPEGF